MKLNPEVFDAQAFLTKTWQQHPRLLRQGFTDFSDPVEAEILAGLAMEDGVDSRIVRRIPTAGQTPRWQISHGPFEEYESLGEHDWTLLVQSVNEWLPEVGHLLPAFNFLPEWRIDDVMVSFSCEGGGVGPHMDQYDVFIIQGQGRRHWRVGARQTMTNYQPCEDLTLVKEPFVAVIDEVLEPGDVLYIPAGCPHDGIALEPSLNYSVGFRAPSQAELLLQVGDLALQHDILNRRYQDPPLAGNRKHYQVDNTELTAAKQLLIETIQSGDADELLLRIFSQSKRPLVEPDLPYVASQIPALLEQAGAILARAPGARWLHCELANAYYTNGEKFSVADSAQPLAEALTAISSDCEASTLRALVTTDEAATLLAELLNNGTFSLFLEDD